MTEDEAGKVIQISHPAGLCGSCRHVKVITSAHGSRFYLCRLAATDARFRRYPVIPVRECVGYAPAEPER